ncbi:FAM120AOS isoform 4 [Pongo abelii]|uniref:FAM120AOS isoform 4 n=1 Tax=Pongo abelii TaxID=9601 RepID=A0A2J8WNS4_PONAB|nr:FAM120AOS isoform 4 [Pongo abelii]
MQFRGSPKRLLVTEETVLRTQRSRMQPTGCGRTAAAQHMEPHEHDLAKEAPILPVKKMESCSVTQAGV